MHMPLYAHSLGFGCILVRGQLRTAYAQVVFLTLQGSKTHMVLLDLGGAHNIQKQLTLHLKENAE